MATGGGGGGASPAQGKRTTFRHGDLRRALLEAGVALARAGGPEAVVLREATRQAGVAPNAAYRHFANQSDLLEAVRSAAIRALAVGMEAELSAVSGTRSSARFARRSLRAVGSAYMRFALREPGLFRTAFSAPPRVYAPDPANAGNTGLNPFQLLGMALDRMVEAGILHPKQRPGAEFLTWSTVHGLSWIMLDGPLRGIKPEQAERFGERLLTMVEQGLR